MKTSLSLTLSEYRTDRLSVRSVIASLLLRTTMSWPKTRKYRTSVPFRGTASELSWTVERPSERTITIGQRRDVLPDRDTHGEIQHVPQDRITLWAWGIWQGGSLPSPYESEDGNARQQQIEDRGVDHGDKEGTQGHRTGSYSGDLVLSMRQTATIRNAVDPADIEYQPLTGWHDMNGMRRDNCPVVSVVRIY